jgi:glycosyltransferase involved in cell wall biosynthesis
MLLVALPALNEAASLGAVVKEIPRKFGNVDRVEIVVIDDGSSDETEAIARSSGAEVIRHERTRGLGAAFHTALRCARERGVDLLVTIDADGQFDPALIPELVAPVMAGEADFSTASRFKDPSLTPEMPWINRWGNYRMSQLVSRITGHHFYDVSCGMRCYSQHAMIHVNPIGTFTYTQEVFLNLAFKGLRIAEVPIPVRGRRAHGNSRMAHSVWRYAIRAARIIVTAYRDYKPFAFFGRLALLLAVAVFLASHYWNTGGFTPHKWAGFTSAALLVLAVLMLFMGVIGDMLNRHRIYLEELLAERRGARLDDRRRTREPLP